MRFFAFLCAVCAIVAVSTVPMASVRAAGAGDLVKCPEFSAVYYLAEDGNRYVFPNENVFFSWYPDFNEVRTISCDDLASFPIGELMTYQAGTSLVKFPSVPTVYVVEPDGVLRAIPSEEAAAALFGDDWAERVDDFSESFFSSVTIGEELAEGEVPEGTILADDDGDLFRVEDDGTATEIDAVLDTDQETVLESHAVHLDDIERELGIALALTRVDAEAAVEVLERLLALLKKVDVEDDDTVEVEEVDEIEDGEDDREDAEDAIMDAAEEILEAEAEVAQRETDGDDISESTSLLASAQDHLESARAAFTDGDFSSAEDHADEAKHDAMWARGKAVDHIDDDDDEEEEDDAAEDADESEDTEQDEDTDTDEDDSTDEADDASEDEDDEADTDSDDASDDDEDAA